MAENFTKLFGSITASTVWMEDSDTRIVWVTMLAMADHDGYVGASIPGLASIARVPIEKVCAALEKFKAPDPYSRSKEHDGRRIEEFDRGWVLLNYGRFRELRAEAERRERDRVRQQRKRERDKATGKVEEDTAETNNGHAVTRDGVTCPKSHVFSSDSDSLSSGSDSVPLSASDPDPERAIPGATERAAVSRETGSMPFRPAARPYPLGAATIPFLQVYDAYPRKDGKAKAAQVWQELAAEFHGGEAALSAAILDAFGYGLLKRHPYTGENRFRPMLETFLVERRWEDKPSAPDDADARAGPGGSAPGPQYRDLSKRPAKATP